MKAQILFDRVNHFHLVVRIKENMIYKYSNPNANAVRSTDADRFKEGATSADLSASARPDNVNKGKKNPSTAIPQNADPEGTSRFKEGETSADLSASARPDNVNKSWFEEHKWETIELASSDVSGEVRRPVPHRHFAHLFNAYARYFNNRTGRTGNLFERPFKRKCIHNEKYLKQVILYVHNNPIHHGFCNHLLEYPWSSYITCVSEKPTKLKRERVLKLFEETDNFKKQHNQKIDIERIEKYLELDEVDYTTELRPDLNANDDDSYSEGTSTGPSFNAVRSTDADRFTNETKTADLSASARPDNVKGKKKMKGKVKTGLINAVRSTDADRFTNEEKTADLTASARPVYPFGDNVNKNKK